MTMIRRTSAEFLGTLWLVVGGCGNAVLAAALVLYVVAIDKADDSLATSGLAANGYAAHSPGQYAMASGLLIKLAVIAALGLLLAACSGVPTGTATNAAPDLSITSYKSGYGVRTHAPQNAGEATMDWGL